jgi:arsenate reductase
MAQGFLKKFDSNLDVHSAGTEPAAKINEKAVLAMKNTGIDISDQTPKSVDDYLKDEWDYVITVCDEANETCPVFYGKVKNRLHMGFQDPSKASGTDEFIWSEFLRVRDEIKEKFYDLWLKYLN